MSPLAGEMTRPGVASEPVAGGHGRQPAGPDRPQGPAQPEPAPQVEIGRTPGPRRLFRRRAGILRFGRL